MVAKLAHTLHLPWEFAQQQACLSANAPEFAASMGTRVPALLNVVFKGRKRVYKADGKLDTSRIGKPVAGSLPVLPFDHLSHSMNPPRNFHF